MDAVQRITVTKSAEPEKIYLDAPGRYRIELVEEGSQVEIFGGYTLQGSQRETVEVQIVHAAPRTSSATLLRGVVDNNAHLSFTGTIVVESQAQHINAFLTENILLLSETATAHAVPNLEIEANEVKCSHAATISPIPPEHIFYLQTRGLSKKQAEDLIVEGFLQAVKTT